MRTRLASSLAVLAVTSVTAMGLGSGTASAQVALPSMPALPGVDALLAQARATLPPELLHAVGSAAAPAPGTYRDISGGLREGIIGEIDAYRVAAGRGALAPNPGLDREAQAWADQLAARDVVEHNHGLIARGFGENIVAAGVQCGARCLVDLWKASPGHNENLLDGGYRSAGMGIAYSASGKVFVVHDFAY